MSTTYLFIELLHEFVHFLNQPPVFTYRLFLQDARHVGCEGISEEVLGDVRDQGASYTCSEGERVNTAVDSCCIQ